MFVILSFFFCPLYFLLFFFDLSVWYLQAFLIVTSSSPIIYWNTCTWYFNKKYAEKKCIVFSDCRPNTNKCNSNCKKTLSLFSWLFWFKSSFISCALQINCGRFKSYLPCLIIFYSGFFVKATSSVQKVCSSRFKTTSHHDIAEILLK